MIKYSFLILFFIQLLPVTSYIRLLRPSTSSSCSHTTQQQSLFTDTSAVSISAHTNHIRLLSKADIKFLTALRVYQSLYHTTDVPYVFVVPESSSWPSELWSYSLGVKVNHIRHQGKAKKDLVRALESMGFEWSARSARIRKMIRALEIFRQRFGHTKVPSQYQVPHQSLYSSVFGAEGECSSDPASAKFEWPRDLQGFRLGSHWRRYLASEDDQSTEEAHALVSSDLASWIYESGDGRAKLAPVESRIVDKTGGMSSDGYMQVERVAVAVEYFQRHFGNRAIPEDFHIDGAGVPSTCSYDTDLVSRAVPWSDSLRDLDLGKWLQSTEKLSQVPLLRNLTLTLCTAMPGSLYEKFKLDLDALERFKSVYSHLNVPSFFVVPRSKEWPVRLQGLKLGYNVRLIRKNLRHNSPEQLALLREIGLDLARSSRQQNFDVLLQALETHNKLFGDLLVPRYFVVPAGDDSWPRETWGLKLGSRVNSIRAGTSCKSPEQRARLRDLGLHMT